MAHTLPGLGSGRQCASLHASQSRTSSRQLNRTCFVGDLPSASPLCRHAVTSKLAPPPQSVVTTSTARMPATHLESSKRALEQLKESTVNRKHKHNRLCL